MVQTGFGMNKIMQFRMKHGNFAGKSFKTMQNPSHLFEVGRRWDRGGTTNFPWESKTI